MIKENGNESGSIPVRIIEESLKTMEKLGIKDERFAKKQAKIFARMIIKQPIDKVAVLRKLNEIKAKYQPDLQLYDIDQILGRKINAPK